MIKKYTIITAIGLALILSAVLWLPAADSPEEPTEPDPDTATTTELQTYENEEYSFSLQYPDGWAVAEDTTHTNEPMISLYRPDEVEGEPPFIHHSSETHVSVYPQGIPTEGFFGETARPTIDFSVPINRAENYVLADGTAFATYANVEALPDGWNEAGFLFAHTTIADLETECQRDGEVIPDQQCDVLMGDTIVRDGEIDVDIRAEQVQILESFRITN